MQLSNPTHRYPKGGKKNQPPKETRKKKAQLKETMWSVVKERRAGVRRGAWSLNENAATSMHVFDAFQPNLTKLRTPVNLYRKPDSVFFVPQPVSLH